MKSDINMRPIKDIAIAVVRTENELAQPEWNTYFINLKTEPVENVIVVASGYGQTDGRNVETTKMRYFLGDIPPKSYKKVEPLTEEVFAIANEYWASFYQNREIFDKKYVFVAGSIAESNFTKVPLLNASGVMIK